MLILSFVVLRARFSFTNRRSPKRYENLLKDARPILSFGYHGPTHSFCSIYPPIFRLLPRRRLLPRKRRRPPRRSLRPRRPLPRKRQRPPRNLRPRRQLPPKRQQPPRRRPLPRSSKLGTACHVWIYITCCATSFGGMRNFSRRGSLDNWWIPHQSIADLYVESVQNYALLQTISS
jgi:hypothetical protein